MLPLKSKYSIMLPKLEMFDFQLSEMFKQTICFGCMLWHKCPLPDKIVVCVITSDLERAELNPKDLICKKREKERVAKIHFAKRGHFPPIFNDVSFLEMFKPAKSVSDPFPDNV